MSNSTLLVLLVLASLSPSAAAKEMTWEGTLDAQFNQFDRLVFPGAGVATLNEGTPLQFVHLAGGITGSSVIPVTDPTVTAVVSKFVVNARLGTGDLSPFAPMATPQLTQNTLPMEGYVRVCVFASNCGSHVDIPLVTPNGEKGIGIGGTWTVGGYGAYRVSVESAPWTILTATMVIETPEGSITVSTFGVAHGPLSWGGSAGATNGIISVVTPIQFNGDFQLVGFGRLTLRFVPEPSLPLLLGPGLAGLLFLGRTRIRSQEKDETRAL